MTKTLDKVLFGAAFIGVVGMFMRLQTVDASLAQLSSRADSLASVLRLQRIRADVAEEVALANRINDEGLGSGPSVLADSDGDRVVLVYWMSPNCAACSMNYSELRELAVRFPGQVVAWSPDGVVSVDSIYRDMGIPLGKVSRAEAKGVFPGSTFPVTLFKRGGRRLKYVVGKLNTDSATALLQGRMPKSNF